MDNYDKILKELKSKGYKKIIISGPQRAGTRFTTNAIAHDLDFKVIDELDYEISNIIKFKNIFENKENIVTQAPALSNFLHTFKFEDTAIVFMYRKVEDIIKSQNRIKNKRGITWTAMHNRVLTRKAKLHFKSNSNINWNNPISKIKYQLWEKLQIPQLKMDYYNLTYESLSNHSMWKKKEDRINFKANQIK